MPLKDGNGNTYKIFKGAAKPVNLYRNGEQLGGYEKVTLEGQTVNFENTYDDVFDSIQIRGGFTQDNVTQPKANSITVEYPTFASNYVVDFQGETIEIPKTFTLDNGTEVNAELKGIRGNNGNVAYYDYIEVLDGSVKLYKVIQSYDVTKLGYTFFANKTSTKSFSLFGMLGNKVGFRTNAGLCNAFLIKDYNSVGYNSGLIPYGFSMPSTRLYFSIKNEDVGVADGDTESVKVEAFNNWLKQMSEAGTPVIVWYASTTPTKTDITNSDIGRELLKLRTHYKNTNISATAEGATPSVSATIKVNDM